ncbi:MAG: pilus assembly protein N-terminal domain-containing protein [Candidatus Omnitrophica bacterium]|nr:pilus assembly protein N-terminal domain-containing protein [Candidatus Omnitrophota bacterium]
MNIYKLTVSIISFILIISIPSAMAADGASSQYQNGLREILGLIEEFERELYLTNEIINIRDEGKSAEAEEGVTTPPTATKQPEGELELRSKVKLLEDEIEDLDTSISGRVEEAKEPLLERIRLLEEALDKKSSIYRATRANFAPKEEETEARKKKITLRDSLRGLFAKEPTKEESGEELAAQIGELSEGTYRAVEVKERGSSIDVEREETVLLDIDGLKRFMVLDPDILQASRKDGKLSLTGLNMGSTFVHVWDNDGLHTIKVIVRYQNYKKVMARKKIPKAEQRMKSFKVRYSFDRSRTNSKSDNPDRSYHETRWTHGLNIEGETPWGMAHSTLKYEGEELGKGTENERDLTFWNFDMKGSDMEVYLGDIGAGFSELTLPGTGFQGARFRNPDKKNINYDFLWGVRGSRMWGYKLRDWPGENYFWGSKFRIEPADFINFDTTYVGTTENTDGTAEYIYSGGVGFNFFNDAVILKGEAARGKLEDTNRFTHAQKLSSYINLKDYNFSLVGTYRNIETDYASVTGGGFPYEGQKGYYFDSYYKPMKNLNLSGSYNYYRNRESPNPTDAYTYNYEAMGNIEYYLENTRLSFSAWKDNYEGNVSPTRVKGFYYGVSRNLSLPQPIGNVNLTLSHSPMQYASLSDPSTDYIDKRTNASIRFNVIKNLYYDLGHEWHYRTMREDNEKGTVRTWSTGLNYSSRIFDLPLYGSLGLHYRDEIGVMENLALSSGESYIQGQGSLRYSPSPDLSTYINVNYKKIRGDLDHSRNRRETRIYGGGTYFFDTTLRWGTGGSLTGYIFKDLNGNGAMEPGEPGVSNIVVYAGKTRSATTDENGHFDFKKLKESAIEVMYDTKLLPPGYKPTTRMPTGVELARGVVSEVYFGVRAVAEINGMVFNDVNMNGVFDDGDEGVQGAVLGMDDGSIGATRFGGYYRMMEVSPGERTIALDPSTLPFNLTGLSELDRKIDLKEGQDQKEDFPLFALRTVIGYVFVDSNGNRRFDSGEEGVADVIVQSGEVTGITDDNGRFFLKKLPGGKQPVTLDQDSIPKNHKLTILPTITVELAADGEVKEDVFFPLGKR